MFAHGFYCLNSKTSNPPADGLTYSLPLLSASRLNPIYVARIPAAPFAVRTSDHSRSSFSPREFLNNLSRQCRRNPNRPIPIEQIDGMIRTIRGTRVMLDRDLAKIYGAPTKAFNQAVKRNRQRFPEDFMFRLSPEEAGALQASRSQFVTLKRGQNVKYLPYAFTEYGALMAANIGHSRSPRSCQLPSLRLRLLARLPLARVLNSGTGRGR